MHSKEEDRATLTTVTDRFNKWRLPRALEIRKRLEKGETLTDTEIDFLHRVFESAEEIMPIIERNPEFQPLANKVIDLFHEITSLALENDQVQAIKSGYKK
ncbi:MAG: hypothetical protein ACR2PZ_08215 [Pseudomonadales bacterium]